MKKITVYVAELVLGAFKISIDTAEKMVRSLSGLQAMVDALREFAVLEDLDDRWFFTYYRTGTYDLIPEYDLAEEDVEAIRDALEALRGADVPPMVRVPLEWALDLLTGSEEEARRAEKLINATVEW